MTPPSVILHGALDIDNFGDVLLARIFSTWLREEGFEVLLADASPLVRDQLGSTMPFDDREPAALVYIGGGYFGEPPRSMIGRWRWGFRMIERHIRPYRALRRTGIPTAVVGVGVGPVSNLLARREVLSLFREAKVAAVRDAESAGYLTSFGLRSRPDVTADAALTLSGSALSALALTEKNALLDHAANRPIVAVHLDKPSSAGREWAALHDTIRRWAESLEATVVGITDQRRTLVAAQQKLAATEVTRGLRAGTVYEYQGVDGLLGVLAACDLVVTTKLHVGIVATALRRPVLALPSHSKTERFYAQIGEIERCVARAERTGPQLAAKLALARSLLGQQVAVPTHVLTQAHNNKQQLIHFLRQLSPTSHRPQLHDVEHA